MIFTPEKNVLELIKLRLKCRIRGLSIDIENQKNKDYFRGAKEQFEELLRHLETGVTSIKADIECAYKYLSDDERKLFKRLTNSKVEEDNNE